MVVTHHQIPEIEWVVYKSPSTDRWIATCESLGQATESDSEGELTKDIDELMRDLFEYLIESGRLIEFLDQRGFRGQVTFGAVVPDLQIENAGEDPAVLPGFLPYVTRHVDAPATKT